MSRPEGGIAPLTDVLELLEQDYPSACTELDHRDVFELLVATVLSAQTTDVRVNAVTPELFERWPDPASLGAAGTDEVEQVVRPLGMGRTRARRIIALAAGLLADHDGQVPDDERALTALPGVGRKTSHVVRGAGFGRSLLAVDTHVGRVSRRLGWTGATDPRRVEDEVCARVAAEAPVADLTALSLRLILHGRRVCLARSPRCGVCRLAPLCPSAAPEGAR